MDNKELTDFVLDSVARAKKIVDNSCDPDKRGYLNELQNYYSTLEKCPENFQERKGFLKDFKEYFVSPYERAIENFNKRLGNMKFMDKTKGFLWGLEVKVGFLTTIVGVCTAMTVHPAFGLFALGGAALVIHGGYSAHEALTYSGMEVKSTGNLKTGLEGKKEEIEAIKIEELDEVLIDNRDKIEPLLYSKR